MRWLCVLSLLACSGSSTSTVIRIDDASDEALLAIKDAVAQGKTMIDDTRSMRLTAPSAGATFAGANKPTFTWQPAAVTTTLSLPHGIDSGRFVWLAFEGGPTLDVIALTTMTWTPDDDTWQRMSGDLTVKIYTANLDRGVLTSGPFVSNNGASVSIHCQP